MSDLEFKTKKRSRNL